MLDYSKFKFQYSQLPFHPSRHLLKQICINFFGSFSFTLTQQKLITDNIALEIFLVIQKDTRVEISHNAQLTINFKFTCQ